MKKKILIVVLFLLVVLAWSPWQTKESAEKTMMNMFEFEQVGVIDGCGFSCKGCGIVSSQKILFGYLVNIKYKCGLKNYFREGKRLVFPFGISLKVSNH